MSLAYYYFRVCWPVKTYTTTSNEIESNIASHLRGGELPWDTRQNINYMLLEFSCYWQAEKL